MRNQSTKRHSQHRDTGATILECAATLPVMLLVLFALLDLGLAAMRHNTLAEAARRVAREAIVHGSLAPAESGTWGPSPFNGTAASGSPIVASLANMLPTMEPSDVAISVTWLDNDNTPRDRVRVEVSYEHQGVVPGLATWGDLMLRSTSTMRIVN